MKRLLTLLLLASMVALPAPVRAQDGQAADIADLLVPAGAWLVGPATLTADSEAGADGMPCVMVNKFDNNMELRFSGGGEEILALALNVGTAAFAADQSYLMTITFESAAPIALPAQAFSEDTVVVGTEPGRDFYKSLKNKQSMGVQLGDSVMEFSLLGVPQGLKRLENCYKPAPAAVPAPSTDATGIRKPDQEATQKVDQLLGEIKGNALPPVPAMPAPSIEKAESVVSEAVVSKASDVPPEEAPPPRPAAPPTPPQQDVKPRDILNAGAAPAVAGEGQQMRWRAMKGANLQSIFDVWARSAQVRLIWNAGQGFSIPESLAMQGTFEAAVEAVLAQFPAGQKRPVGKTYIDPVMKQKVLVIELDSPPLPSPGVGSYAPVVAP